MKQGLIIETNKKYHSYKEAISKSRLAKMDKCPHYFKWCEENPQEPTDALIEGSAFHKIVLEPQDFDKEFVIAQKFDKRTKQGKEEYESFIASLGERQAITQEQYDMICGMRDSILQNKYAKVLLQGNVENSMYAVDDLTQEPIKARPDVWRKVGERIVITDLKSCRSAITEDVIRDVCKYGYDLQAFMYTDIASKVLQVPKENIDFVFIFCEKTGPYLVNVLQADSYVLQRGENLFRKYIGEYHYCKENNDWYGLNGSDNIINNLSLPNYLLKGE